VDVKFDGTDTLGEPGTSPGRGPEAGWESVGKQVPNWLTALRFALVPVFVILMAQSGGTRSVSATLVFLLAAATDWLDGYIARLFRAESILGTVLDPLADKILVMAALVMLAALPDPSGIPAWMAVIMLSREMIITGLRSLAALQQTVVPASRLAKHKTVWTFLAIVLLLLGEPVESPITFHSMGMGALWIALALTVISGFQYAVALRKFYR